MSYSKDLDLTSSPKVGELWRALLYSSIRDALGLDERMDIACRDLMYSQLKNTKNQKALTIISAGLRGKPAIVFGAGPSLDEDIEGLEEYISRKHPFVIAADGAAEALSEAGFIANLTVSDLDSCSVETLQQCSQKGFVFAHGHGDNSELVRTILPQLPSNKLGTTQVATREPVRNFGGFTDGDRACFIASFFEPSLIVIAGMDFGEKEGRYSLNRYGAARNPKRPLKLEWGKRSLEFLIQNCPAVRFQNVTKNGVEIRGIPKIAYEELI